MSILLTDCSRAPQGVDWIFGAAFLKSVYSVYEVGRGNKSHRVGLAKLADGLNPPQYGTEIPWKEWVAAHMPPPPNNVTVPGGGQGGNGTAPSGGAGPNGTAPGGSTNNKFWGSPA